MVPGTRSSWSLSSQEGGTVCLARECTELQVQYIHIHHHVTYMLAALRGIHNWLCYNIFALMRTKQCSVCGLKLTLEGFAVLFNGWRCEVEKIWNL